MGPGDFVSRRAPPRGGGEVALRQVTLLDTGHREGQAVARSVTGPSGHLAGNRVGVEHPAAGGVRRRTLDPAELVRVPELERERAGVVDRQALLQLELRGEAGGTVVRLVVQIRVRVHLRAVDRHVHLTVRPQAVQGAEGREVRERQVRVLGHGAGVGVRHGHGLVVAGEHVVPGEGRVIDRGTTFGADLDLADGPGHTALLDVLQVRTGLTGGVEGESDRGQEGHDGDGDAGVDASDDSGHTGLNSSNHALISALPQAGHWNEL